MVPVALAVAACGAPTVRQRSYPRLEQGFEPIHHVAVVPFSAGAELAQAQRREEIQASLPVGEAPREPGVAPGEATALVARYVAEALGKQGLDVTAPEDMGRVLAEAGLAERAAPRELARLAHERFGAGGVVVGTVSRYRERTGGAQESGAASVWFEVALYNAPQGEQLWSGVFNETQRPLSSNVLVASRYPGGGSRWLSAEELARWGAEQTAAAMPLGTTSAPGPKP